MFPSIASSLYALTFFSLSQPAVGGPSSLSPPSHPQSPHAFNLTRIPPPTHNSHSLQGRGAPANIISDQRAKYLVPITIGAQSLSIELDTGSSDTWLLPTDYSCYITFDNSSQTFQQPTNHSYCNSGPTFSLTSSTFHPITSFYQRTCYGSGKPTYRCISGPFYSTTVSLNNLTIPDAILGAPNKSSNYLLGAHTSGILGLGFPAGTRAYSTSNTSSVQYPSILSVLFNSNHSISPLFSLALSRDVSNRSYGGIFTIGGIPNHSHPSINVTNHKPTVVPLQYYPNVSRTEYSWYAINITSFTLGEHNLAPATPVIVDSGYNGLEIPKSVSDAINSAWSPPGVDVGTNIFVDCNATLPYFGITIGETAFGIKAEDLIGKMANGTCYSLVIAGLAPNGYSLGDPLLRNTLVAFDWGRKELAVWGREEYES